MSFAFVLLEEQDFSGVYEPGHIFMSEIKVDLTGNAYEVELSSDEYAIDLTSNSFEIELTE